MHKLTVMIVTVILLTAPFPLCVYAFSGEIDATAVVVNVHDGDTFTLDRAVNGSTKVRLADINAPELGQPLSNEARDFLDGLVLSRIVYLDIDDIYVYDYSGTGDRLVCVVYIDYNSTHCENVNKGLLVAGLAEKKEYDNEFSADAWTLYVPKIDLGQTPVFELPLFLIVAPLMVIIAIAILLAVIVHKRKHAH
jgi:micrococcal nuclease